MLRKALECGDGELTIDQLRLLIVQGNAHLLVAHREKPVGAAVIEFKNYPNFRAANVIAIGGMKMFADASAFESLVRFAKIGGASKIEGYCPIAVARLWKKFNFREAYSFVRRDI